MVNVRELKSGQEIHVVRGYLTDSTKITSIKFDEIVIDTVGDGVRISFEDGKSMNISKPDCDFMFHTLEEAEEYQNRELTKVGLMNRIIKSDAHKGLNR